MRETRSLIAAVGGGVVAVAALAACGDDPVGSSIAPVAASGDVIVVTSDSNLARQLAARPDVPPPVELTVADGVSPQVTAATLAWTSGAGEPTVEVVQALAVALGADGEVERDAAGAWSVDTSLDSTVGLLAGGYLGDSFMYTSAARWDQLMANPCAPSSECPGPVGVADQATALDAAQRVLDALDIERTAVDVGTEVRTDGMIVTVRTLIDGAATQTEPDVELLVGSDGSVLQAHGRTSIVDQTRTVDLIDAGTAVARAENSLSAGPFVTGSPIAELPATTSLVPMTTSPPAPRPSVDTVTGFGVGHELVWDVDGRRWMVPTFTVSTARNSLFVVFAIEADMVRVVDAPLGQRHAVPTTGAPPPPPFDNSPAPALTTTIPGAAVPGAAAVTACTGTPPSDQPVMTVPPALPGPIEGRTRDDWGASMIRSISPMVVGLPTTDAAVLLEQACWTVRISYPGGPTTTITPDLRWDRIVLVDDGNGRVAGVVFQ